MTQHDFDTADFSYDEPDGIGCDPSGMPARVAIYGDFDGVRREIADDLSGAGFRTVDGGRIANLIDGPIAMLGDAVMIDCPSVDTETLAALTRLDMRVAQAGAQLIVSTSLDSLDDVFGALDQSDPQILVRPSRSDRVLAVGRILADISNTRVREMSAEDRVNLLHLSRQVEAIAQRLEGLTGNNDADDGIRGVESDADGDRARHVGDNATAIGARSDNVLPPSEKAWSFSARESNRTGRGVDTNHIALPDPRLVRQVIAARQARARFFDSELFSDPAWDMLLDLTAAHGEGDRVSVTSLCIAAAVPATTALRWLKQMVDNGLFVRLADPDDKRRAFIALSDQSLEAMSRYFAATDMPLAHAA